ncbi:hypothetical protein [Chitinophaga nivalis]|uniref:Uncharacterized protein n=1 Tax=Chitinophaga nivalis TaxID=2991709 RepID=A0ABT3IV98_9BACT|nr:hypothetical protein [Chitinophaga nivalis]MCW3462421.1 hypothetical protein [Chitinophaga nivalis]MCW3487888.1 hypothetical protein [Chitinophaga nivalis]
MKHLWYIGSFLLLFFPALAQEESGVNLIIHAQKFKKGLYKSFAEFQNNSPSADGDLVIKTRSNAAQIYLLANRNELVLRDAYGQEHKVKNYWGYCDGQNIYVRDNGLNKIQELGFYCIYEQHGVQPSRSYINQADMTINSMNTPYRLKKLINILTGEILELSAYNLKKYILPQDPELLKEFRADRQRKDQEAYYIYRFNQRNKPLITTSGG